MHTTKTGFAVFTVALVLMVGAEALAQGAKPRLDAFDKKDVLPGSPVTVMGTNFTDDITEVKVTVDGDQAIVLSAAVEQVQFLVPPEAKAGELDVRVFIAGRESNSIRLKVLKDSEENREQKAREDAARHEDPGRGELEQKIKLIELSVPQGISERGQTVVRFGGKARLPEGCLIALDLTLDGQPVGNTEVEVTGPYAPNRENFQGQFGPFTKRLFSGKYIEAHFRLADQPAKVRFRFRKEFEGNDLGLAKVSTGYDRNYVDLGSDTQKDLEEEELRRHFRDTTTRIVGLLDDLELNFSVAARSDPRWRRSDGTVAEEAWQDWLKKRSLKGMSTSTRSAWIKRMRGHVGHLTSDGGFDEAGWREWIDRSWREEVLSLFTSHRKYADKWQVMRFHDQVLEMESLFGTLIKLSQRRSSYLYESHGLPVHRNDMRPEGADQLRLGGGSASPIGVRRAVERVLREVGLEG